MERRKFIRRACAASALTTTGLAGCIEADIGGGDGGDGSDGSDGSGGNDGGSDDGGSGDGDGDSSDGSDETTPTSTQTATMAQDEAIPEGSRAPYDRWASSSVYPAEEVQASSVDMRALQELDDEDSATPTPTPQGTQTPIDPILAFPMVHLFTAAFSPFALMGFGLSNVAGEEGPTDKIHTVGDALVFEGSYDAEELGSTVTESQAEAAGDYEGYTLYTMGDSVLAISGEALVTTGDSDVTDPQATVEGAIDASAGNAASYGGEHEAYEELVTSLETQPIMGLGFSPDGPINEETPTPTPQPGGGGDDFFNVGEFDLEGDVRGYASSLAFNQDQESATVRMALRYASAGEVDSRDLIRSQAAPQASSVSVDTSGSLVLVSATYSDDPAL